MDENIHRLLRFYRHFLRLTHSHLLFTFHSSLDNRKTANKTLTKLHFNILHRNQYNSHFAYRQKVEKKSRQFVWLWFSCNCFCWLGCFISIDEMFFHVILCWFRHSFLPKIFTLRHVFWSRAQATKTHT